MKKFGTTLNIIAGLFNFFGSFFACVIASEINNNSVNEGLLAFIPAVLLLVGAGMTISNKKLLL